MQMNLSIGATTVGSGGTLAWALSCTMLAQEEAAQERGGLAGIEESCSWVPFTLAALPSPLERGRQEGEG